MNQCKTGQDGQKNRQGGHFLAKWRKHVRKQGTLSMMSALQRYDSNNSYERKL